MSAAISYLIDENSVANAVGILHLDEGERGTERCPTHLLKQVKRNIERHRLNSLKTANLSASPN